LQRDNFAEFGWPCLASSAALPSLWPVSNFSPAALSEPCLIGFLSVKHLKIALHYYCIVFFSSSVGPAGLFNSLELSWTDRIELNWVGFFYHPPQPPLRVLTAFPHDLQVSSAQHRQR
jgi:hypothetical protein